MSPWGGDFAYGKGTGSVGAVSSYYYSDKAYPDPDVVETAIYALEKDEALAKAGENGWTKKDAAQLRKIAANLRLYYYRDYNRTPSKGLPSFSTRVEVLPSLPPGTSKG